MKIDKRNPRHWLLLLQQGIYTLIAIVARKLSSKPPKPVVVLYGHQLSGNLQALYEGWQLSHRHSFDCHFLSLDPEYSRRLRRDGVSVLQCNSLRDMLRAVRCDAMVTDHGLHMMSALVRLTDIRFIDVWHGIPYKGFVPEDFRLQQRYDEVWVSSNLLKRIYEQQFGFADHKVVNMGYARADKLFRGDVPAISYRRGTSIPKEHKLVLYAPTWQQSNAGHELFPFGETQSSFINILNQVCGANSATLVIRSHLNASISEEVYHNVRYCPMKEFPDTEGILQETDVLICDWSSIAFDYLALNRPAIFLDVPVPYENGLSLGPEYRYGEVVQDMPGLSTQLELILQSPERYAARHGEAHQAITAQVYGENVDGHATQRQLDRLKEIVSRPGQ